MLKHLQTVRETQNLKCIETVIYQTIRTRKRKKTISIMVGRNGQVTVRAPVGVSTQAIDALLDKKRRWIQQKQREWGERQPLLYRKQFVSGERFLYLGESFPLEFSRLEEDPFPLKLSRDTFFLDERWSDRARDLFVDWYKTRAGGIVRQRVEFYSQQMQLFPQKERITSGKYRWGGCTARRWLSFNWRIVMAPLQIIDYLVVHELAHIRERSHSPTFWSIVETFAPDYRASREWLKSHGDELNL